MESENNGISLESNAHPLEENDEIQQTDEKMQGRQKRKLSSQVSTFSEHFPKKSSIDGKAIAKCKHCGIVLNCDSKHEIDNLKRYSENCVGGDTREIGQMISSNQHGSTITRSSNLDPEKFRELVIGAIFMHNLPLSFVEYRGSRALSSYLHEDVTLISRNTLKAYMINMHRAERKIRDSNYKYCPSEDEWERVEKLYKLLAGFYDVTCVFSRTKYPTANLFFPSMFIAHSTLQEHMSGQDVYMKNMSTQMLVKFVKYWSDFSLILAIAVILDPRYKIHFVEWSYGKLYGNDSTQFKNVRDWLFSLFNEYAVKASPTPSSFNNTSDEHTLTEGKRDFFEVISSFLKS
ncbi:hypothetical protein QUC31_011629 [Theobroma cacao]